MAAYEAPTIKEIGSLQDLTLTGVVTVHKTGSSPDFATPSTGVEGDITSIS